MCIRDRDELSVEDVFRRRLQQEAIEAHDAQRLQELYRQVVEELPKAQQ